MIILLTVILVIVVSYYFNSITPSKTVATYMSKEETMHFLKKDNDMYVSSLTIPDLYARKVQTHAEYIDKCIQSALDFDKEAQYKINKAVIIANGYFNTLESKYISSERMNAIAWKFALSTCEEGLPHTREDIIFLSPSVLKGDIVSILIHEKVHVYQRKYLKEFRNSLIANGYTIVDERINYPLARSNPDLDKYVYANKNGNIMIMLYTNNKPDSITDVVKRDGYEHPFEEIAYEIGDKFV